MLAVLEASSERSQCVSPQPPSGHCRPRKGVRLLFQVWWETTGGFNGGLRNAILVLNAHSGCCVQPDWVWEGWDGGHGENTKEATAVSRRGMAEVCNVGAGRALRNDAVYTPSSYKLAN